MSLQIWLPLTKDKNNYGLYSCTPTDDGITQVASGKLGSCYEFNPSGSSSGTKAINLNIKATNFLQSGQSFSCACWFKLTGSLYSNGCGLISCAVYKTSGFGMMITKNGSPSGPKINIQMCFDNGEQEWAPDISAMGASTFSTDTWYHVCYTFNQSTGKMSLYINGALIASTNVAGTWIASSSTNIRVGVGTQGGWGYTLPGQMNDARIYDHCLSPKEVKEIAQGLVVHYKLDDEYSESTTNLASVSADYSNKTYGVTYNLNGWGGDTGTYECYGSGGYNNGPYKVYHKKTTGTGGVHIKMANDITLEANKTYTMSVYVKASRVFTDSAHTFNINRGSDNHYITYGQNVPFTLDWVRLVKTFTTTSSEAGAYGEMSIVYNDAVEEYDVYYSCFQIEEKDHATPWVNGTRNGKIYDCSGYGNDGTIMSSIQVDSNSPRYDASTLNTELYPLNVILDFPQSSGVTFASWVKLSAWGYQTSGLWATSSNNPSSSANYNATTCNHYDGWFRMRGTNSTSYSLGPCNNTNISLNTWYHIAVTHDGVNAKLYINGILSQTLSVPTPLVGFKTLFLGYSGFGGTGSSGRTCKGNWSDFRMYATALSDADIKELYDTAASIDNGGNLHDFECVEEKVNKGQVLKTGIVKTNEFVEKINYLYLPAGKYVSTGLAYAANDVCKSVTIMKYDTNGSGRDLMGWSTSGQNYWGVDTNGAWELHNTGTYTDSDITKKNTITYNLTSTASGTYIVGALQSAWSPRNKYIYSVKLYKNGTLERDLIPATNGTQMGLYDLITKTFYPTNSGGSLSAEPSEAKIFDSHIEANQLIER